MNPDEHPNNPSEVEGVQPKNNISVLAYIWDCGWLRTYPPRFGLRLRKLRQQFCKHRVVDFKISDDEMQCSLESFFESLEWSDLWDDANMVSVLAYLRASKSLQLGSWRRLFPKTL